MAEDRYGLFASFEFGVAGQSFSQMDRVVKGLRGIEMATKSSDQALQSASLGRQFQQVAAGVREMDSRTSQSINPLKALRQEFRALRAEARNIDFGGVGDTKMFRSATREVHQYVEALESLGHQVAADTTLEREFAATLKQQQRVAQQRVDMAQQQRKAIAASERLAGAAAVQGVGQAAFAPLAGFEQDSIRILRDFSDQMSQVQAVSDMTAQQLESVRDKSKKLGAQTRFSASEAASGFVLLAQAGYPVEKQLAAIDGTLNLAAAGNLDLARATEITVSTLGQFQLGAEQATHAANVLAQAAAMGQIDVSDIGMSLKYAGISAKRAGLGIEQASSMLALLSEGGLKGEMAGTALGQMLDGLVAPASTGAAALKQLGVTTTDAQGKLLPYEQMLGQTIEALGKVSNESERAALTNKIFGVVGGRAAGILMPRFNKLATTTATIIKQSDQGIGAAQKQAAVMEDNIGGAFRNFSSAMEGVKVALIEPLEPLLRFIIDTGSAMLNFVTGLPAPFRVMLSVGVGLVTALTGLASVLGTVGVAAFGMQQAIATAGVGMVALRGSALPLTGFFETALAGFAGNPAAGIKRFGVALSGLPGPIGMTATSMRGLGAAMMSALLSPLGLAIAGLGLLLLVASHLAPGVDLLGASLTLLTAPLKILGSFLKGVGSGFQEALGGIFGTRLDPVVKDFTDFFDGLSRQIEQFQSGAENFGQVVGKGLAQIFVPLAKAQAAITRSIVSLWIGTIRSIMAAISPLVRFVQAVGSAILSALAENSPGLTDKIRAIWHMTVESIRNGLGQLPAIASDVGMAIWEAFKWVAEGTAELFRGLIGGNISAAIIPAGGGAFAKTVRHRFGELLGDVMTAPVESGTENDVISTFLLIADRVDETVALIQENLSIVPETLRAVLGKVVARFGEMVVMVRNAEASFAGYVAVFGKAIGITGLMANMLSRYPRLIGGLATGLKLFGGMATGIGLVLTLNDRLRVLRFGLVSVDKLLERFGISADWLDPVIKGLDSVIGFVSKARTTVALFLRSILFGQWDTVAAMMTQAFDTLSSGVQTAIAPMLPQWNRLSDGVVDGCDRIVGAAQSVLEQLRGLKSGASAALERVTQNPLGSAIAAGQSGLSFVQNLGVGITQGIDGMLRQILQDTFASLNGLGAAGLGVAFLSLFFVPAGIPQVIAGFLPLLIAGLSRSGVLERLQNWLSRGFSAIVDQIDQQFGRQEALHRLIDVFGQVERIARSVGMALANLVDNVLVRIGAAFTLMVPAVSSFAGGLAELYRAGGITAVLGGMVVQARSLLPILMAFKDWSSGLTVPIKAFVQAIMQITTTFPVVQRLLTMLEGVVALAARLPAGQQMIAAGALAIAGGRRVMAAGGSAMAAGQQVAVTGIDRVIQLMMWIGTGVYQIARPGVDAVRNVPAILKVLSRILGVSTKILNPLPALISLSGKAVGRDGKPRITPIDILGRMLPDFLISGADKAVTGSKVRGVLEQRQAGFQNVDPFKQRELVGKYTERLANPLGLLNTPLFGPAAIASIELLGGSLLGLVGIVGIAAAALYVFKPAAAKPIFAAFRTIGNMVMGVAFVLTHLGQTVEKTGDALTILGFKMAAPQWAVNTSRAINAVISGIGAMAIAITNAVDFVFGIVPTLIRSAVLLVPLALMGVASLVLTAFRDLTARLITDTRVLGDAIVQGFQRGDWSSLGQILRQAFTNAFRVTLQPVLNLVKFLTWNMFLKPIGMAIGAVVGLFVGLGGSILDAVLHPVRLLKQLAGAVMVVGAAIAAIQIGAVVTGIVGAITRASAVVETVASGAAVIAETVGSSAAAVGGVAAVTTVALSPVVGILGAIAVAIAVVTGALVLGYRDGFESLIGMLVAIQHPIDFLNHAMSNLITLITTPVKPLDWLFSPISDFLGGIGKNLMKYFPLLIGAFFGLNIVRKGLINGMISGFMMVVNAITQITSSIMGAILAMVTLGRRSREYSQTLEGQVLQEGVKQKGSAVMQRLGIGRPSAEPLAVRQEQERQFKEKSAIVRFRREIEKLKLQAEQEYGQAFMSLDPSYRVQEQKKALGGLVTYKGEGLSSKGKDLSRRGVAEDVRQGQNQFTDENLQAIAKKVGLNMGEVPGLLNLRELVTAPASKMEEVQDLYSQSIANIRLAEMQIKSAQVEIVADSVKFPNVVDIGSARSKTTEQRKLKTSDDVLSLPFSSESVKQMARLPGASAEVGRIVEQLQALETTRGDGKETRLADVSLSMVKSLAAEMGVYQERTARDPDYRFMQTYEGSMDKQGVPAITKQLLMLQMMAKTGQIANPEELAKGFIGPAEALKTIHNAMDNLQKANKTRDENQAEMLMQSAMTSLKANFNFLKGDEIGRLVTSLSEDTAGPDEGMKALRLVLGRQVDLILANSPVVAVAQATEQVASSMNAATAQVANSMNATTAQVMQQTQQIEKGAASSGIGGFFKAVVERAKRIQRDINDSDTVVRMRDNAQEGQRYRAQAAQSTYVKSQLAATSQTIGASGQVDFMRKIGVLQDPSLKIIESTEQQVSKALNVAMTKQQEELLFSTIRTISTTSAKDVMGKLQPEALAALTAYARQLDPSLTVETLLNAMRSKGKGLSDETNSKLKASLPAFDAPNLKEFFKQIGLVTVEQVPLDALGKQYKDLIQQKYMPDIQQIEGGAIEEISPPVKAALSQYAKDYGLNLKELVENIRTLETHDIIQTMREAGAIQELANPSAIAKFFKSANVAVPSTTLDTPEAKAALKLMKGNLSNINSEVTQGVLRTIARSANVDVSQLIAPSMTPAKLRQARPKRMEMLMQRTGVDSAAKLPEAMGDISPYNFEAIASGKTYAVADSEIDKVVKALKFKDRQEFEQAISAITLMQETRAGLLGRVGAVLSEQVGNVTGFSAIKKSQGYRQQLQQYRQTLGRSTTQTGDPLQDQQNLAPGRTAGLQKSLVDAGKSQRQLTKRLGDLGLSDIFESYMKTGQWVQRASAEQLEILYREGFAQQITPEKLAALRQSLEKQGVTDVFLAYLNNGKFLNADAKKQEKVLNALRGTIGGNIGEQQLEDIQYLLRDNELTGLVSAYLKTGEFVTKASAQDKQAIANAVMGNNSTIEELENLHQNLPEGRFGKMKVAIQLFALGLRDGLGSLGEVVAEGLEKTPMRPVSQKIIQSFQKFQNQFKSTAADMKAQISASPIGTNIAAVQKGYQKTKGRSLQGMTEAAGFGSLEEFVTAFRARLQQRDMPEQSIDRELLAVLKPDKRGLRAGMDKGGMDARRDTLKVMGDLLGLAGADRERLSSAGGYTTDAVDPIQVYFVKRLPKILVETTGSVMTAATKAAGRAGVYGLKLAIQRFSPKVVQQTAQFSRKVGFGLSNTVNRIRESLAGTPLSKMLLPLENALDLRTRQVGRFLDHQAEAIAQVPPPIPIVERVKNLFQSLAERFTQVIERVRQGIDAASSTASKLFAPLRSLLGNVFGMMQGAFGRVVGAMRSAASKVTGGVAGGIGQGMMGRYRQGGGLAELDQKSVRESFGANGVRLRSAKGNPAGRFLSEGEAVSTGSQRALGAARGSQPSRQMTPPTTLARPTTSYPMLPDPWEETHAEGFFKGIAKFTRALKRAIPEASTQTVEFFRSVNEEGDRQLRSVRVEPLHQRILARMSKATKGGIEQLARAADRGAGIKPSQIQTPTKPPKIAGMLPPAGGMPPETPSAAKRITQAFTQSAERVRAAWARTGEEVSGKTWGTMVQRAYRTGLRILGFISEASPGPSQQIRQNYAHTADAVEQNFTQMEHAAHESGAAIANTMKHAAETTKKVGIGHTLGKVGAGAMKLGGAGMAIGGAIGTAGFAAQSVASSLSTLGLLDEESSKAIFKFTELFSVITTIGGVVTPLIGAVVATLGAIIPVVVGIGGAIFGFLVSPIGIAAAAIIGTVLLVNEALKRFFGVDLLAPIVARAWGFAKQIASPLTSAVDLIEAKWQGLVARFGPVLNPIIQPAMKVGQQLVSSLSENSPGPTFMIRQNWANAAASVQGSLMDMSSDAPATGEKITQALKPDGGLGNAFGSALGQAQQLGDSMKLNQESLGSFLNLLGAQSTGDAKLDQMAVAKGMSGVEIGGGKSKLMDFGLMQAGYSKEQIEQVNKIAETLESPAKRLEDQMAKLQLALTELRVAMTAATLLQKPLDMMKKAPTVAGALSAVEPTKTLAGGAVGVRNAMTGKISPVASGNVRNAVTGKVSESAVPQLSYFGKLKKEVTVLLAKLSIGGAEAGPLAVAAQAIGAIAASPLVQVGALLGVALVAAEALTPGVNLLGEALGFLGYAAGAVVGTFEGILAGLGIKEEFVSVVDYIKKAAAPLLYVKEALQRVSDRFHEARGSGEAFGKAVATAGIQAVTTVQFAWLGFAAWFMTMPLVGTAIAMGEGLIGALNCNPTVVIPLAWENAVLKVIEWIEKLPGVGSWAAGQLREGMKPDGWLSGAMKGVSQFTEDVGKKFKGLETVVALPKLPETSLPAAPPPPPPPPKASFRESLGDDMALLARGGDASALFTPGIEQASYGVQFLTKSFRRFGSEAFDALKSLDFDAVGKAAQGFGDRAGFAVGIVVQGFRSMSISAIAFGAASLIGLGPLNLGLLAAGLLLLAVATNFLGLRNIVMGGLKVAIGLLRVTVALVKGAAQIIGGSIKVIAGAIALLGGNFDLIHEGIAQVRAGFHTIATGAAQGLRQMLGGAIQFVKGLLQGLRQIAATVFGGFKGAVTGVWGALKNLRSNIKLVSNALMTALAKPQEAWERFLGVANKVGNAIRRVTNSPQVVKDPTPTGSGLLRQTRGSRLRQAPGSRLRPTPDRNLSNDSLDPKAAASEAAYAVSSLVGMISPALAAPAMAIGTLVDGFSSLGNAFPVIAPLAQKGMASFMALGFGTSFAAGMTGLLTAAQLLLAKGMVVAGTAASGFWVAITGPLLPVVLVIGAIVLAVTALILLFRNGGLASVLKPFRQAWYAISDAVRDVFEGIGTALNRLGSAIAAPFEPLLNMFGVSGGGGMGGLIAGAFQLALSPILLVGKAIGFIIRLVGAVIIGIIEIATMVTSTLLTPVARVISFLVDGFRGLGQGITQGFGGAISAIARPIAETFQALMVTLRMVGDSLLEPFEPLLQMFGTSGAGGLGSLLGKAFKMLLSPLNLFASAIGLIIKLVGVVLVGAVQLVGALLKPLVSVLIMPVMLLGQMIRGIVWMAQSLIGMVTSSVQMLWSLMPPPLRWLIETAAKGMGLAQGSAPPGTQPQRFASGGLVTGAGGIDQIPALLSNREFVVTPEATRQNYGFLQAINSGVPAEQSLNLIPTTAPAMVKPMGGGMQAIASESSTPSISVVLNFNGNIILTGGSGAELANEMMQHLEPKMEIAVRDALRDMVERMR